MAKRKRLSPANPDVFGTPPPRPSELYTRAPIADIAADASTVSALEQISQEMSYARESGRMVLSLSIEQIQLDYLVRDRVAIEDAEMQALMQSIETRGQQSPVEVMELSSGRFGLISGWRRCHAIIQLAKSDRHDGKVMALLRRPETASDAYLAMVEENELRVGLSYYERARIAAKSVQQGVFETEKSALLSLFPTASRSKRSKIRSFLPLVAAFDGALRFPHSIGERLGLRMAATLQADATFAARVISKLAGLVDHTAKLEHAIIECSLKSKAPVQKNKPVENSTSVCTGVMARWSPQNGLVLSGKGLTPALRQKILDFIADATRET